ncbi:hypothetical protein ASH01_09120 [Terrabacter sp. Soil811]|uniref:hypothetical protein n=1 Tax=Terrabacter sp. Soil811 TaxID=1736419 RepID=UPI0007003FB3|nr:hypothetical protein [Terrabacter sp. Soil811]KRF45926.1 hypothetical protein ASH01_09120 [Terrabacter sp. Soil811]
MVVFIVMKPLTHHVLRGPLHPVRPGRAFVALALGSVLVTSACGQATPSPGAATPAGGDGPSATAGSTVDAGAGAETATSGGVRLEATMAPGGPEVGVTGAGIAASPGLVVDYTLTNTGTKPVLAYDVVPADLGSATLPMDVDAKHAWVYEESGVLRLSKQGFAPGPNVRFAAAPVMGGHTIAPGASITGKAYAVSPPTLDVPGDSFEAPRTPVDPAVKQWQFCVQVSDRAGQARPSAVGGGVLEAASAAPQGDELVCTPPSTIPVA